MTMGGGQPQEIEILADIKLNAEKFRRQLQDMLGNLPAMAAQAAGRATSGIGNQGATEAGTKVDEKATVERQKVRTQALQHLAQQFPGGGLMTQMAGAFKSGGIMAGLATGMGAAVGILTGILKSSQVFQTLQNTVFKTLGMMADLFLMPFVPYMMRFVNWMLTHMPQIQQAGEKTVDILSKIWGVLTWGSGQTAAGKARGGAGGFLQRAAGFLASPEGLMIAGGSAMMATGFLAPVGAGLVGAGAIRMGNKLATGGYQMGGKVPGGPGEPVPTMLHGGEIIVPQDIAAGASNFGGRVASWIERFQQKEMGPGGVLSKWYDEMFGHSIIPDMWGNIRGLFQGIETEASAVHRQVGSSTKSIEDDQSSFWDKLKFWEWIGDGWKTIMDCLKMIGGKIKDFFTFDISIPNPMNIDWAGLWGKIGEVKDTVEDWFVNAFDWIMPPLPKVDISWSVIWDCMKLAGAYVWGFFSDPNQTGSIPWAAVKAWNGIKSIPGIAVNLGSIIKDCFNMVKNHVVGFFTNSIPTFFTNVWNKISGWVPSFDVTAIWNSFKQVLDDFVSDVKSKITSIPGRIGSLAGKLKFWNFGAATDLNWSYAGGPRIFGGGGGVGVADADEEMPETSAGKVTAGAHDLTTSAGAKAAVEKFLSNTAGSTATTQSLVHNMTNRMTVSQENLEKSFEMVRSATIAQSYGIHQTSGGADRVGAAPISFSTHAPSGFARATYAWDPDLYTFGTAGRSSSRGHSGVGGAFSSRVVNVQILSNQSVHDIVRDVERLDSIQEASFFNSVM